MPQESKKPIVKFEPGSRQPFILYLITVTIISVLIIMLSLFTRGVSFSKDNNLIGDINQDKVVDLKDIQLLSDYLEEKTTLTDEQKLVADADGNGEINSKDSILIMQHIEVEEKPTSPSASSKPSVTQSTTTTTTTTTTEPTSPNINPNYVTAGNAQNSAFFTSEANVYYVARIENNWKDENGKNMYQVELVIKNNSEKTVYNTSCDITFSGGISVEKEWGCSTESDTGVIKLKTENNGKITKDGTYRCGFIISSAKEITIKSITK